ncbi:MAG: LTA synthase family protein [Lachnospiraceae bacterium]|nr:LTA synthase family protein [Lachnospiraceae bacterium]
MSDNNRDNRELEEILDDEIVIFNAFPELDAVDDMSEKVSCEDSFDGDIDLKTVLFDESSLPDVLKESIDDLPDAPPVAKKEKISFRSVLLQLFFPSAVLVWDEVMFHIYLNKGIHDSSVFYILFFAAAIGFLYAAAAGFLKDFAAKIVSWSMLGAITVWFTVQATYHQIFNNYLTFSVMGNAGDAKEFWKAGLSALWSRMPLVLLLLIPLIAYAVLRRKGYRHKRLPGRFMLRAVGMGALCAGIVFSMIDSKGARLNGRFSSFYKDWQPDRCVRQNGIMVGLIQDVCRKITYDEKAVGDVDTDAVTIVIPPIATPTLAPTEEPTPEPNRDPGATPTPTPTPVDRSPHVLDLDFSYMASTSSSSAIKTINEYLANVTPTNKNEYTGMFEGYNLIVMTCETFHPLAIREDTTPTLYRMVHSGFYFDNFYTPYWITSTSDGEYTVCTGLLPDIQQSSSFSRSSRNVMACCLGHIYNAMGYTTYAFHNHSATYYDRDKSHPNMGYEFIARGRGLNITEQFPESDLEMMEQAIPMFINEEHFHVYFMTMSGHMVYEWGDNAMGRKHRNEVKDLPYSEQAKCYLACNIELENAVNYLITKLDEAGVLDNTLIVMSGDHYPYGLPEASRNELAGHKIDPTFERYKEHLIIWNPNIRPQTISKAACSLDILPTVLNLMGIEYDSRLYMGTDIFSDSLGLVQFKDYSFITDYVRYNANTGAAEWLLGADTWDDGYKKMYLDSYKTIVKNKFNISRAILNNNYYKTIADKLWWMQ